MDDNSPGFVSTRPSSAGLGPQGEAEWQRLRAQLELAEGFWLGFVFVQSRADAEELRRRVEGFLRASVRRMTSLEPKSPGYLRRSLGELLEHGATDLMWLQAVERGAQRPSLSGTDPEDRQDDSDPADESWDTAWSDTLLRANEHRERLRNEIGDGLVFVLPTPLKPEVRRTAPDLWSIRSLVLEVEPVKRGPELSAASFRGLPSPASDPLRPLSATEPDDTTEVDESIDPTEPAETLLRRARARLLDHRPRAAALLAAEVAERLEREHDPRFADVLAFQAEAEVESGDPISALAHIGRANALKAENVPERGDLNWLDLQFKLALRVGDLDQASRAAEALLSRARTLHNGARTPEALRDLSTSLDNVGDVRRDQGRLDDAANAYDESLDIARRLANDYAPTPEALRDLSVSWNKVGDVRRDQGRLEDAANAFDESLDIARRLANDAPTPEALRDLSISLERVGDVRRARGLLEDAANAFDESLDIRRRLANDAPTPEALRDLSVSWNKVGDVRRARGLLEDAGNAHDESLDIRRRLANDYGPTPEALRDLSVGLERVGDVRRTRGRLEDAGNAHDESLDIRRRLAKDAPTPEALRDLSLSLWRVGDLAREAGEADRARALLEESRDLQRQLLKILDPLPQVLGDSKLILGTLRDLYEELSDTEALEGASDELTALSGTGEPPTEPSPG